MLFVQCRRLLAVIFAFSLSRLCVPHNPIKAAARSIRPGIDVKNGSWRCYAGAAGRSKARGSMMVWELILSMIRRGLDDAIRDKIHPQYSPDMSPCDYNLFAKVKEPLRGTRYNIRAELIRTIGQPIRNINKDGRTDGVRRLPSIWQKVINKGSDYLEGT